MLPADHLTEHLSTQLAAGHHAAVAAACRRELESRDGDYPTTATLRTLLAEALLAAGDLTGAAHELSLVPSSNEPEVLVCRARLAFARGDIPAAEALLKAALRRDDSLDTVYLLLHELALHSNNKQNAFEFLCTACRCNLSDRVAIMKAVNLGSELGAFAELQPLLKHHFEFDPFHWDARAAYASAALLNGDLATAKVQAEAVLATNPSHPIALQVKHHLDA